MTLVDPAVVSVFESPLVPETEMSTVSVPAPTASPLTVNVAVAPGARVSAGGGIGFGVDCVNVMVPLSCGDP